MELAATRAGGNGAAIHEVLALLIETYLLKQMIPFALVVFRRLP